MTKNEISRQLHENHQAFIAMMLGFTEADFTKSTAEKWTPGQQLDHIRLSVKPLVSALAYPDFILRLLFGKANRDSKTYDQLIAKYKKALDNGGAASPRFVPKKVSFQQREPIATQLSALVRKLENRISGYPENKLDTLILPHPLLGKLTLREMLYFTNYHVIHHHQLTNRDLNA